MAIGAGPYLNAARRVYELFGKPDQIGCFNRGGYSPTPEAVRLSMEWLRHFLWDPE